MTLLLGWRRTLAYMATALIGAIAITLFIAPTPEAHAGVPCVLNPACLIETGTGSIFHHLADDAVTQLAKAVLSAVQWGVEQAATLWTGIPTPVVGNVATGQAVGTAGSVQHDLGYLTGAAAVMSILVGAVKVALSDGRQRYHARHLGQFLLTYVFAVVAMAGVAEVLILGMDQLSGSIITSAIGNTSFATRMGNMLGVATGATGSPTVGLAGMLGVSFAAIILGIFALLGTVAQVFVMYVRDGMLVLLVATIPLAAAASNTEAGMHWLKKSWAWLIAFALYKPAAAVVYAVAFTLSGTGGATNLFAGIMMLVLAVCALPALLKFVVPAAAAMGGVGAGTLGAGIGAGALGLARHRHGGGSGGPSGGDTGGGGGGPTGAVPLGSGSGRGMSIAMAGGQGAGVAMGAAQMAGSRVTGAAKAGTRRGLGGDDGPTLGGGGRPGGPSGSRPSTGGGGGGARRGSNGGGSAGRFGGGSSGGGSGVGGGGRKPAGGSGGGLSGGVAAGALGGASGSTAGGLGGRSGAGKSPVGGLRGALGGAAAAAASGVGRGLPSGADTPSGGVRETGPQVGGSSTPTGGTPAGGVEERRPGFITPPPGYTGGALPGSLAWQMNQLTGDGPTGAAGGRTQDHGDGGEV